MERVDTRAINLSAHTGISGLAQEILDIGKMVWDEVIQEKGTVTALDHKAVERRIDAYLKAKFPNATWHPNFAGMIGGYTEMLEIDLQLERNRSPK